jgi:hypothetical protein
MVGYGASGTLMLLWLSASILAQSPWGPRVTAGQVRVLQQQLPAEGVLFTEGAARYLTDAVVSYCDLTSGGHALNAAAYLARGTPCYFATPLNNEAVYAPAQHQFPRSAQMLLCQHWDLVPVAGMPPLALGAGRYALGRVEPFVDTLVRQDVATRPGTTRVIWLDLKESGTRVAGQVRVRDTSGELLLALPWPRGPSLRILVVPGERIPGHKVIVELEGDGPIPRRPIHAVHPLSHPLAFDLGWGRPGSCDPWFGPPFRNPGPVARYIMLGPDGGRLFLPPVLGAVADMDVLLSVEPEEDGGLALGCRGREIPAAVSAGGGGQRYYSFHLASVGPEPVALDVAATGRHRLTRIRFTMDRTGEGATRPGAVGHIGR